MVASVILIMNNKNATINKELRDFAVEDTSSVTKIFMVNKSNDKVLLERKNGIWWVNNKFKARPDAIYTLLKTLSRMDVKSPVPKSAHNTIIKRLATQSMKVEVFQGDKKVKVFYVGGPTSNNFGTYMLLEGSDVAFVVHIPGFNGYLSTRFFVEEELWRSSEIFNYSFSDITYIKVQNPGNPSKSFKVYSYGDNRFGLESSDSKMVEKFDTVSVKTYFAYFKNISYQSLLQGFDKIVMDSIINSTPYYILEVSDNFGKTKSLKAFLMPPTYDAYNLDGKPYEYDPNVLYAYIDNKDFVTIQFYVFDPLFKEIDDFIN